MRNDDQIKAALSLKKEILISTGWEIKTPDKDVKAFLVKQFETLHDTTEGFDPSFEDALKDMLSFLDFGFSLTEPVYEVLKDQGLWGLKMLRTRPPHTFKFFLDKKGNVVEVVQGTSTGDRSHKPGKFIHLAYQADFGNPYGKPDLRAAYNPWKAKKYMDRFYAMYMERYAAPFIVAKYKRGTDPTEAAELQKIVKNIQISTGISIPEDTIIDIVETSKDASEAFERALNHYNMRISRAILVPDLLGMGGGKTDGGSYSLGQKQFGLFIHILESIRKSIARKITLKLIRPLALANFGDIPVEFCFLPYTEELLVEHFKVWYEATSSLGVNPTQEQIDHLNKSLGFPEGKMELKEAPQMPQNAPEMPPGGAGKGPKPPKDREKEAQERFSSRKPTTYEAKMDFRRIEKTMNRLEDGMVKDVSVSSERVQDDFIDQVRKSGLVERADVARLNKIEPRFLREFNAVWKAHFEEIYKESLSEARAEIVPGGNRGFVGEDPMVPAEFLDVIKAESFKIVGDYSFRVTKAAKNILVQGIKDGIPSSELFPLVRSTMQEDTDRWIRTVVRTKTTEIYNETRKSYFETDPVASKIVEAYQWSAILDARTSRVCRHLDKKIFKRGDFTNRVKPPAHFSCRSVLVPITKFEKYEESKHPSINTLKDLGGNLILGGKK